MDASIEKMISELDIEEETKANILNYFEHINSELNEQKQYVKVLSYDNEELRATIVEQAKLLASLRQWNKGK